MKAIDVLEQQQNDEVLRLEIAYSNLYKAYISGDRDEMITKYIVAVNVNILGFKEKVFIESRTVFISDGRFPNYILYPVNQIPLEQLELNVIGCLNALQKEIDIRNIYRIRYTYAQNVLYKPAQTFHKDDILYQNNNGHQLKVADFLAVSKYAISIAEAIEPSNKEYAEASAAITVLQGIDAILNNKPEDKPINKMLHLANSFISSVVKSSIKNDENKRDVTVTALMVDMVIDFFCKK